MRFFLLLSPKLTDVSFCTVKKRWPTVVNSVRSVGESSSVAQFIEKIKEIAGCWFMFYFFFVKNNYLFSFYSGIYINKNMSISINCKTIELRGISFAKASSTVWTRLKFVSLVPLSWTLRFYWQSMNKISVQFIFDHIIDQPMSLWIKTKTMIKSAKNHEIKLNLLWSKANIRIWLKQLELWNESRSLLVHCAYTIHSQLRSELARGSV